MQAENAAGQTVFAYTGKTTVDFTIHYTVKFNSNGGTAVENITLTEESALTGAYAPTATTREGYTILGWYKDAKFTNTWNFAEDTVTGNVTLYAKWAPNNFEVKGIVKDSSGNPVGGAAVKAVQGDKIISETTTGADGAYSFGALTSGAYNIVATYAGTTKTELVTITACFNTSRKRRSFIGCW